MASFFRTAARALGLGKQRYYRGQDLMGNSYFELPSRSGSSDPRHTRRQVQWREKKELGDYDQRSLPVQWTMWLRHTRREPPTIEELQQDMARIRSTQQNARLLDARYDAERRAKLAIESEPVRASSSLPFSADAAATAHNHQRGEPSSISSGFPPRSEISNDPRIDDTSLPPPSDGDAVWEASRARIAEQDARSRTVQATPATGPVSTYSQGASTETSEDPFASAIARRAARRASRDSSHIELERARSLMRRSPLEAFDPMPATDPSSMPFELQRDDRPLSASAADSERTMAQQGRLDHQTERGVTDSVQSWDSAPKRPGRPNAPSQDWEPQGWSPTPAKRR